MKIGKYKISFVQILRAVSQIIFFLILPALFISTFIGVKQIYLSIIHQNFSITALLPQLIEAISIIPITVLIGRFFCGWMCAFGAMGDFIYMLSSKLFKRRFKISEKTDSVLKFTKYILLAFLITVVWSMGVTTFSTSNPWDVFGMLLTFGKIPDISYVFLNLAPALFIFLFIVVASFFVERFFCRYLCPLGAIFSIVSKPRITSILKPKTKCGNCRICTKSCPMGIALYKKNFSKTGECINCFKCVSVCPRKNVSLSVSESNVRPILAGTMAVTVMTGIYYMGSFATNAMVVSSTTSNSATLSNNQSSSSSNSATLNNVQSSSSSNSSVASSPDSSNIITSKYKDGTYQGFWHGF